VQTLRVCPYCRASPRWLTDVLDDGRKLYRDFGIIARNLVELGRLARLADHDFPHKRSIVALHKMVALYTAKNLEKGSERTSDWEVQLSTAQQTCT
jgi:hypothetical protein